MAKPGPASSDNTARLMLVVLSLGWGTTWPVMRIALDQVPPFSMRVATMFCGATMLMLLALLGRRTLALRGRRAALHVAVAGLFNVVSFTVLTPFAQLHAATSRVSILVYSMPIWATLMARLFLGERITGMRAAAFVLCLAGLVVLMAPIAETGVPLGLLLALGAALGWAAGTIYLKWADLHEEPMAVTFWQVVLGFVIIVICQQLVEGGLHLWPIPASTIVALVFAGAVGSGIAYFLWFEIVRRLSAMTASLGVLSVPAVGVVSSVILLGERPTLSDIAGFALILAASACVLLAPQR
ncbi:MAG TPA: DMT family transporter [Xanthobacteraceae bacterium]|nr:DMT family transporter [Xanthobacteraceae bacterium]